MENVSFQDPLLASLLLLFRLEVRNIDKHFTFYYNIDENDISKRRYKNEDYNKNQ
ncbi:hypothetical protein KJ813_08280 [bacterium]|nr:hypothetical protein [bacterium]